MRGQKSGVSLPPHVHGRPQTGLNVKVKSTPQSKKSKGSKKNEHGYTKVIYFSYIRTGRIQCTGGNVLAVCSVAGLFRAVPRVDGVLHRRHLDSGFNGTFREVSRVGGTPSAV